MGIIKRFINMVSANANAAMDNMENSEAMIDQQIRNMNKDLAKIKADAASVIATRKEIERKIDVCKKDIDRLQELAKVAAKDNDADALRFLQEKALREEELNEYNEALTVATVNAEKMKALHNQMSENIKRANSKSSLMKSKIKVTKTQKTVNEAFSGFDSMGNKLTSLEEIDERITRKMDEAFSYEECDTGFSPALISDITSLESKYASKIENTKLLEELAAIKASV